MYTWNMEQNTAIKALSALAHDGRLTLIRMLIVAGDEGIIVVDSEGIGSTNED